MVDQALEKHPTFPKLWLMKGQIIEQSESKDKAREVYTKAVSILSLNFLTTPLTPCYTCI